LSDHLLTQREYAEHRGCSQPYIAKLCKAGRIPLVNGKIDPEAADAALAKSSNPANLASARAVREAKEAGEARAVARKVPTVAPPDPDPLSYNAMRTRREGFLAKQAELDYRRSIGEVCEVAAATKAVMDCAVATRRLVEQIPNRIANQLAAAMGADVRRVQPMMQAEIERICDEIANTAQALPEKLGATSQ
jgi:predicted outer membrane protein